MILQGLQEGDRGVENEIRSRQRARNHTHTQAKWNFLVFYGPISDPELHYDSDTKQFTWNAARQSKAPKVLKKTPKYRKICKKCPEIGQRRAESLLEDNKFAYFQLFLDPRGWSTNVGSTRTRE